MKKHNGFTVVEIIVVIAVISILGTLGLASWRHSQRTAADATTKTNAIALKNAIEKYYEVHGEYPFPRPADHKDRCNWENTEGTECTNGQLAFVLVPDYLSELPKSADGKHFQYVVHRAPEGTGSAYGLIIGFHSGACATGKNLLPGWWTGTPRCDF